MTRDRQQMEIEIGPADEWLVLQMTEDAGGHWLVMRTLGTGETQKVYVAAEAIADLRKAVSYFERHFRDQMLALPE